MADFPQLKFGRYEIKSELGRGGMATVFHAYDPSFERDVAIKVLPPAFLHDPQLRMRFEREAKMIASLEHPAIVPVYDFGEEDGQPYIVMRYMSGGSLAERVQQGAMSITETERIISRLAPALDAAHARGIIHRDLKPGNVLFDQYGNAFLSDFGIARLQQQQESATLTGSAIVGTPAFMSPEQVQGEKTIDGRSDIYALGVLVFQMLSGQAPYQADTPAKVMLMHLLEPVPHILSAKADLPPGCDTVIQKAMAKNPDDRYPTAGEMASALESATHMQPGATPPPTPPPLEATMVAGATVIAGRGSVATVVAPSASLGASARGRTGSSTMPAAPRTAPPVPASASPAAAGAEAPKKRSPILLIAILGIGGIIVLGSAIGLFALGSRGSGPLAMLGGAKATPTAPAEIPTQEGESTATLPIVYPGTEAATETSAPSPTSEIAPTQAVTDTPAPTPTETATPEPLGAGDRRGRQDRFHQG